MSLKIDKVENGFTLTVEDSTGETEDKVYIFPKLFYLLKFVKEHYK